MKTTLSKKYIDRLAALNDQLCFFQFNRNELNKRLSEFGTNAHSLFTPDVFAQNSMASRINVTIGDLPRFQELNQTFTFGAYISTSYEVISYYLRDSLDYLQSIEPLTFQLTNDRQLEEKYSLTLTSSGCSPIQRELIDTLKYIRLRRNHFTHLADGLDPHFANLIATSGITLNNFWAGTIIGLDFTSTNVLMFNESETIDILMLLRIIVERLDAYLASNLSATGIITFIADREFSSKPQRINNDVVKQRISKVKTLGKKDFGIMLVESDIDPIVRVIGKR
ncbi:MAG: hypothetical protein COA57_08720 [Flavobacteriales bacterium]|nr:MAG: hypothetical protein COA57_08720 [Flavobacteriales bacterium]